MSFPTAQEITRLEPSVGKLAQATQLTQVVEDSIEAANVAVEMWPLSKP